jgi:SAM-dependent methyltransferase
MQPKNKPYHLGNTDAEHERLIRQATRIAPVTERFFREAGVASGQRVLDIGAGVGDVAMLAAKIVGPSGEVIADYSPHSSFDGVVGRYILQFLPDPAATLRSITPYVRPGGVVAFQEGSWIPFLALSAHLPLWSASVRLLQEAGARAGVKLEMGPALHAVFQRAGLPPPHMRLEMELGYDPDFTRWVSDCVQSVLPQIVRLGLPYGALGDLDTLQERLQAEVASSNTVVPWIGLVEAWCRKPAD